jgi:hypothetical protein
VTIACPVDHWPALVDDIERRLKKEDGIVLIEMPERLPGASPVEADLLVVLRKVLDHKPGINVRSPRPPDGRRSDAEVV